jgi:hypothetical protein
MHRTRGNSFNNSPVPQVALSGRLNTDISEFISSELDGQNLAPKLNSNHDGFKIIDTGSIDPSPKCVLFPKFKMNASNVGSAANSPKALKELSPYKSDRQIRVEVQETSKNR